MEFPEFHWSWWLVVVYLLLPYATYVLLPKLYGNISSKRRVIIVVLGDLGHSPRICYHARSFASKGWSVDLCGFLEEQPPADLLENENVDIHAVPMVINTQRLPFVVFGVLKVIRQVWSIVCLLWELRGANYILVQNPPSIPTLAIAVLFKLTTRAKLIVDWHNLGYSILSIKLGPSHPFVRISKGYEKLFGRYADLNLTVTKAMKEFLIDHFGLQEDKITVLYDKAASQFKPITTTMKLKTIEKHPELYPKYTSSDKILISSTSFTPDEDFTLLIQALKQYDRSNLPNLKVIVTGKGPLKAQFLQQVAQSDFKRVTVNSKWLTAEDYPKVLATADVGVSLHTSSSGIDLPMKVVDMFGCGVPVIALSFPALPELVQHELNGEVVSTADGIFQSLERLFSDEEYYDKVKFNAVLKSEERWESNWKSNLGDHLR